MKASSIPRWTQGDENDLQSMIKRKTEFMSNTRKPVSAVVRAIGQTLGGAWTEAQMVDALITNADAIRDALAPFDSGVRVLAPDDSTPG